MFYIVMLVDFEVWVLELEDADYRETSPPLPFSGESSRFQLPTHWGTSAIAPRRKICLGFALPSLSI